MEKQTGSRVSGMERLWALGEERGQLGRAGERERDKKRERVISPHPASFLFKHESRALPLAPPPLPSLFFSSSVTLSFCSCPFYYLFPFTFFSPPSPHNSPPLISQLHTTAEQQERRKKKKKRSRVGPASRK